MYVEKAKTSENEIALVSRKGLSENYSVGSGPINGIFSKADVFGGDIFTVSGDALYRGTTLLGTIVGSGAVKWANSGTEVVLTRGGYAYSYNGTDLQIIAFPDSAFVTSVVFIGSLFVFARASTGEFYWSSPLDARTIDSLDFATAESSADNLVDLGVIGDNIWMFGKDSIEVWSLTGAADLPFSRIEQVSFNKGIHSTGALAEADNSIIFAGADGTIYRIAEVPTRISDHWLEAKVAASSSARLFSYKYEGHENVAVRLDDETYAFDMATGEVHELQTAQENWIAQCAAMVGATPYFGHESGGQVMLFDGYSDMGGALERRFTAAVATDAPITISNVSLWCNTGTAVGTIELRTSDDAGQTWSDWEGETMVAGEYRQIPEWRALGMFEFPGFVAEFRFTDDAPLRISAVKVNDAGGGRG
jgi:hypothetical protein